MPLQVLLLLLLLLEVEGAQEKRAPPSRIGVIGAGIGGTAAAYFLREKFGKDVHIDVFERNVVGGRMATLNVDGQDYEVGGVIIHPQNHHLMDFIESQKLFTMQRKHSPMAVFNGDEFVFEESEIKFWNSIKLFFKYGLYPKTMKKWVKEGMRKLLRFYASQSQGQAYSSNEALFRALGEGGCSAKGLNETMGAAMRRYGLSPKFIAQIATPIMHFIYGQDAFLNCFAGLMSLASVQPGLRSVEGGNKLICSALLSASKAQLIPGTVLSLEKKNQEKGLSGNQYRVNFQSKSGAKFRLYDIVLFAIPLGLKEGNVDFNNFKPLIPKFSSNYHRIVTTLVRGRINTTFFGYDPTSKFSFKTILTTRNPKLFFNGILMGTPVKITTLQPPDPPVWKVYSGKSLTKNQLALLFSSFETVKEKQWLAWPDFSPPVELPPIILHNHMYYLNGAELLTSAMEMSAIAAKNAVLLAHHRWFGELDKVNQ